jgi:hypothetical protein
MRRLTSSLSYANVMATIGVFLALGGAAGAATGAGAAHSDGREDRPQRSVLLRLGEEVQEVPPAAGSALRFQSVSGR